MNRLRNNTKLYESLAGFLHGGRFPHALLLEGPTGSGKRTCAVETAQGLLCSATLDERPCGICRDCVKVDKGVHPDLLFYGSAEGGSRSFHIDKVRELRSEAYIRPNEAACKVLVLTDVHNMTVQAQNALLKIIEEPPKKVHFILTCQNKAQLLETILSRVTAFSLSLPDQEECRDILEEKMPGLSQEQYLEAVRQGQCSVGKALSILEAGESDQSRYREAQTIFTALCTGNELDALSLLSTYERDRVGFLDMLELLKGLAVDLLKKHVPLDPEFQRLRSRVTPLQLMGIIAIIEELTDATLGNVNGLLLVTATCSQIKQVLA